MIYYSRRFIVSVFCLTLSLIFPRTTFGQVLYTAVGSLLIEDSPRANGMGGCVLNIVNEQSALHNPGGLGLFHLTKNFALSIPHNDKWLTQLYEDIRIKSWGFSGGYSYPGLFVVGDNPINVCLGAAYFKTKFNLGKQEILDQFANLLTYYEPRDEWNSYSVALGADINGYFKLGLGYSFKDIISSRVYGLGNQAVLETAKVTANDFGIIAELPLHRFFPHRIYLSDNEDSYAHFEFVPSFAFVRANSGDIFSYADDEYKLPKVNRWGISLYVSAKADMATVVAARLSYETQKDLVNIGDRKVKRRGIEISLLDIFFLRGGSWKDDPPDRDVGTSGYGFSLRGVITWIDREFGIEPGDRILNHIIHNLDITYDFAEYKDNDNSERFDGTEFLKLNLSF